MKRIDAYFERLAREWNWLTFGINICLALFAVGLMLNMVWLEDNISMRVARTVTVWAFLVGWFVSRRDSRWWTVLAFAFLLGGLVIAWQYAHVGDELWRGLQEIVFYLKTSYVAWRNEEQFPSTFIFMQPLYDFAKGMFTMLSRLGSRLLNLPTTRRDGLARLMTWELGLWLSVVWVNWCVWKKNWVVLAFLPGLAISAWVVAYKDGSSLAFLFSFGIAIILMVIFYQNLREQRWERDAVGYSEYIREHSARAALSLSIVLVLFSGLIASIDFDEIIERVREYRRAATGTTDPGEGVDVTRQSSLNPQQRTLADEFDSVSVGGFPVVNLVGTGPELSEHIVMYVEVDELDPVSGRYQQLTADDGAIYLRALNYERYNSYGWFADTRRVYLYDPGQEAVWAYSPNQRLLRQEISYVSDFSGLLAAVGQIAVIDTQYSIGWREGSSPASFKDMVGAMVPRGEFMVYSLTPSFGEEELRTSSSNYPDWVSERYLDLPESVPQRVLDLAEEITAGTETVYDQAVALEQYLRTYEYTLDLPERPEDQDIVDYFLFDVQKGYCDYYASAMVVMARHMGIPARLAVGYVTSNFDENEEHFVVSADQAHSWVEIYFPGYGWVTFEPTGGRAEITRQPVREELPPTEQTYELVADKITNPILKALPKIIGFSLGGILLVVGLYFQINMWWLRRKSPVGLFVTLYQRLQWFALHLEIPKTAASTPHEFGAAYSSHLLILSTMRHNRAKFERLETQISWLVQEYVRAVYSQNPPGMIDRARALREWRGIRRYLAVALVYKKLSNLGDLLRKVSPFSGRRRETAKL